MKKVLLTGAALLAFAAASFAQNTSTVNQNGTSQTAAATQTGNLLNSNIQQTSTTGASGITNAGNYASTSQRPGLTQPANNDEAFINQIGSKSGFASIGQEGGQSGKNTATINQKNNAGGTGAVITAASGPGAPAAANNTPNAAGISAVRAAGGNYANTYQQGNNEQVTINQNDASKGNYADSRQDNYSVGQQVTINQNNVSTNNSAVVNQFGDNNKLSVSQSNNSSGNTASVRQGFSTAVGGPNSFSAVATVEQNGVSGGFASTDNTATVNQNGVLSGTATIRQNAGADGVSNSNKGTITQTSSGNTGTINQNNRSDNNEATLTQAGLGGHVATINQDGNGTANAVSSSNLATVAQTGSANQAEVNQLGDDRNGGSNGESTSNKAFVTQSGINDQATVNQIDGSVRNTATVNQSGSGAGVDKATINQVTEVYGNTATINQAGSNGNGNTATITQTYAANPSVSGFAGNNSATINQNTVAAGGGNLAELVQGAAGSSQGYSFGNTATLSQQGSFNVGRLRQEGESNTAGMTQTGNSNVLQGGAGVAGSFATQIGTTNSLTLSQTSPGGAGTVGNIANVSQMGTGNGATITQSFVP